MLGKRIVELDKVVNHSAWDGNWYRRAWFDGAEVETPVYDGARLRAGDSFHGPAIIEETTTSVIVPGSYACRVDELRNHVLTRDGSAPTAARASAAAAPAGQLVGGAA